MTVWTLNTTYYHLLALGFALGWDVKGVRCVVIVQACIALTSIFDLKSVCVCLGDQLTYISINCWYLKMYYSNTTLYYRKKNTKHKYTQRAKLFWWFLFRLLSTGGGRWYLEALSYITYWRYIKLHSGLVTQPPTQIISISQKIIRV